MKANLPAKETIGKTSIRTASMRVAALTAGAAVFVCASVGTVPANAEESERPTSEWVYPGDDGRLVYKETERGDRIMDFSHAGYMGGGVAIPDVTVERTVEPSGDDDTAAIQAAIDEVAEMPLENGFRGAVLLAPGTFYTSDTIVIPAGGVVLRGSGSEGEERSTIELTGDPHLAIAIRGSGDRDEDEAFTAAETTIADDYVPSGVMSFTVEDGSGFSAGDRVSIRKPVTEAWVELLEMHNLVRDGNSQTWLSTGSTINTEREIAEVSGNTITLDVPLADSYNGEHLNPPGTAVVKIRPPNRIARSGVEHLHIKAPPMAISHTQPHFRALRINGEDCWARNLRIEETMNSVGVGGRRITIQEVHITREARSQGASRPAKFAPNGSQVLVDRCSVQADNVWFVATGARLSGPIVILNSDFRGNSRVESHQRWATGMLYDNLKALEGGIEFRNRGAMGSGHGWSMGWGVAWNNEADNYIIQKPPEHPNWMIGNIGTSRLSPRPWDDEPDLPEGIMDSHGTPVQPKSLYLTQLAERLGPEALENIGY